MEAVVEERHAAKAKRKRPDRGQREDVVRRLDANTETQHGPGIVQRHKVLHRSLGQELFTWEANDAIPTALALVAAICLWSFVVSAATIYSSTLAHEIRNKSVLAL